jgi:hypothetical protein
MAPGGKWSFTARAEAPSIIPIMCGVESTAGNLGFSAAIVHSSGTSRSYSASSPSGGSA